MKVKDSYQMPFGKYKGKPIGEVPATYLDWLAGERPLVKNYPMVALYIKQNREQINKELEETNSDDD